MTPPNKVTATAPDVIYLVVSDEPEDTDVDFYGKEWDEGVTWCRDEVLSVCVKYIRADLAGETK